MKKRGIAEVWNKLHQLEKNFILTGESTAVRHISMKERDEFFAYYKNYLEDKGDLWLDSMDAMIQEFISNRSKNRV